MYGEACGIARITHLSDNCYEEELCNTIEPQFFHNILGTHTYNFGDSMVVFDFVEINKTGTGI